MKYAVENGILDLSYVQAQIEMNKRKELLEKHPYKIWKGKDGRWYTYIPDEEKGRKLVKRATQKALEDTVVEYWKERQNNPTIKEVFSEWNDRRLELKKISRSTHLRNKQVFSRHYSEFGEQKIKNVSEEDFGNFLEEQIPEHNLTAKAFSNLKTITRGFLKRAKKRKLISYSVEDIFYGLDTSESDFKKTIKEDYEEVFTEEEMNKAMNYLMDNLDTLNLGLLLMFVTGLRVGELCSLKWRDFDDTSVKVRRTETRYYAENEAIFEIKEFPKSAAGVRSVYIPEDYRWIINVLKSMNPFGDFVFMRDGERLKSFSFRNRLYLVCKKTNCYQKSPHKIRKTYGSILLDNNIDKRLVIGQMGHADVSCTENHYHRNRRDEETRARIISNIPEFQTR